MVRSSDLALGAVITVLGSLALWAPASVAQTEPPARPGGLEIVLNGESDRLNVYDAATGEKRTLIPSSDDAPDGLDINAEICFVPDGMPWKPSGEVWFIAGEDTEQNAQPGVIKQGWGIFRLTGTTLAALEAEEIGKLVPDSFVTADDNPENYGCGVLPDGRLVTGDVGDQLPHSPATGQLIVWYPTSEHFGGPVGPTRTDFTRVPHCKIDVSIGTAGGIHVDGTDVYIASNRPDLPDAEPGGVYRYDSTVWPGGETPADGCGRQDETGEQLADEDKVGKELFIPQVPGLVLTPSDIVDSGNDTFYVSSVFSGQVAEYGRDGIFRRHVVNTTGQVGGITPFGIGVTSDGTLWIADIGIQGDGPAEDAGSVVRVTFDESGEPGEPEEIDAGLQFPDGIGITVLPGTGGQPPAAAPPPAPTPAPAGELPRTGVSWPLTGAVLALAAGVVVRTVLQRR